jgi:hypothetical protein
MLCNKAAGQKVNVSFTPHLIPMSRGMQSTIYWYVCTLFIFALQFSAAIAYISTTCISFATSVFFCFGIAARQVRARPLLR